FELPLAARRVIEDGRVDGVVALGVVIRGETPHFDFVAGECARGIMDVQLVTGVPIGFGVLTTDTRAQAEERADPARGDRGYDAALAAASVATIDAQAGKKRVGFR
ncbi:MAG: 6,7-dimethyl-8-ribityllumazine synthase, partial [Candidatus Eremiobacteraeota bacterium]|nr:6,7-dimethyl-8-ribityllumazine synthase [Candidatus Eremiobacteraeota bacterium]